MLREVADAVEDKVGKNTKQTENKHMFLGMDNFNNNGKVSIDMKDCFEEGLQAFPDKIKSSVTSPTRPDLHHIDNTSSLLSTERAELFHSFVMKLMLIILEHGL